MIEVIGYVGAIFFAICPIPQAYKTYTLGHAHDLSAMFLWSWFLGEILMTIYILNTVGFDGPLMINYIINLISVLVILRYKVLPRGSK